MELYAGNERAHRHVRLPGLEGDVIALPSEGGAGGDLYALFSCGASRAARVVLADCVGHGYTASGVARHVHSLLHRHVDVRDTAGLLAALNDSFVLAGQSPDEPLRLSTVVSATYHRDTGEFNFAYAAHPRILWWRSRESAWHALGEGLDGLPLGVIAGERYVEQSVRLDPGDIVLAFSDAVTEVQSPAGEQLTAAGFLRLAGQSAAALTKPVALHDLAEGLLDALRGYHGSEGFTDDLTLLALRRA